MQRRACLAGSLALLCLPALAQAGIAAIAGLPGARPAGEGSYRWFGLKIYDARLWLGEDGYRPGAAPLALELHYARDLHGKKIAEASRDEMRKLQRGSETQRADWLAAMEKIFPDVRAGQRITGLWLPAQGVRFLLDDRPIGVIADPAFADAFFAIWLDPRTSAPGLRAELLRGVAQ